MGEPMAKAVGRNFDIKNENPGPGAYHVNQNTGKTETAKI